MERGATLHSTLDHPRVVHGSETPLERKKLGSKKKKKEQGRYYRMEEERDFRGASATTSPYTPSERRYLMLTINSRKYVRHGRSKPPAYGGGKTKQKKEFRAIRFTIRYVQEPGGFDYNS